MHFGATPRILFLLETIQIFPFLVAFPSPTLAKKKYEGQTIQQRLVDGP